MKTKRRRWWIWAIAAIVLLAVGYKLVQKKRNGNGEEAIITVKVMRGDIKLSVSGSGVLESFRTVEVKSNVGGQIMETRVDEGDKVTAGQVVALVDRADYEDALEQRQAELVSARSRVEQILQSQAMENTQVNASIEQAERSLAVAEADLERTVYALIPQQLASAQSSYDQAQAGFSKAEKELNRMKSLLEQGFVAQSNVDDAEQQYTVAKAQLESVTEKYNTVQQELELQRLSADAKVKQSQAALSSARAGIRKKSITEQDIIQANAQIAKAEAAVKNAQTQLDYTTIMAPSDGVVVAKYVEGGSIVSAGKSSLGGSGSGVVLMDIADITRMFVSVNVDETDIGRIVQDMPVEIVVDAYSEEKFTGKVTKIAPMAVVNQNITTIPVQIEIDNPDPRLKPGMNAICDFLAGAKENVLYVPSEAVKESPRGAMVFVLVDDKPAPKQIKIGLKGDENTEIISGLEEGEVVVNQEIKLDNDSRDRRGGMPRPPGMF